LGSREQALIREFPNGETHLRSLLFRRDDLSNFVWRHTPDERKQGVGRASAFEVSNRKVRGREREPSDLWTSRDQEKVFIPE
jgi:hypothetical protein